MAASGTFYIYIKSQKFMKDIGYDISLIFHKSKRECWHSLMSACKTETRFKVAEMFEKSY